MIDIHETWRLIDFYLDFTYCVSKYITQCVNYGNPALDVRIVIIFII